MPRNGFFIKCPDLVPAGEGEGVDSELRGVYAT
jgi:hypothetical protein